MKRKTRKKIKKILEGTGMFFTYEIKAIMRKLKKGKR